MGTTENKIKEENKEAKGEEEPEEKNEDKMWTFLEHKGPVFVPPYEPLPANIKFYYDGDEMALSPQTEEVASFYARMLNHDYTTKKTFNDNFFNDWKKVMTENESLKITELKKCDFRKIHAYFKEKTRKYAKEEKQAIKERNEVLMKEFGLCNVDGLEEKVSNFRIPPPGLFRGGEENPKSGIVRRRIEPEDVIINCSKDSKMPEALSGHKWKEVRHDDTVTWLASWDENVENRVKYMMLNPSPKLKEEEEPEEKEPEGKEPEEKGTFLEHKGPVFAPPYEPLPANIKFYYDGEEMKLSAQTEEVASFYARMLDHDYTTKKTFNDNFFNDWKKVMTESESLKITELKKCDFRKIHAYYKEKSRSRTKEEKQAMKEKNETLTKEFGFCNIDGREEKISNFTIASPGLFRGDEEDPKIGMVRRRVEPEDVIINCSKDSKIPEPPSGHKWKEVRHDDTVTWLASWDENVENRVKYMMLNPGPMEDEKYCQKYEIARKLHRSVDYIRARYRFEWKSRHIYVKQKATVMYFIDKFGLRLCNEDEEQDIVGLSSLRVEHIALHEKKDGKDSVVVFDFVGKDSFRYYNEVAVEKLVFKNLLLFMELKKVEDVLFDRLEATSTTWTIIREYVSMSLEVYTTELFNIYNASWILQQKLDEFTNADDSVARRILSYIRAMRAVAILRNHKNSVPKWEKLEEKIQTKEVAAVDAERQIKDKKAKHGGKKGKTVCEEKKQQQLSKNEIKLEIQEGDMDEIKYLDPRITVAWCKKYGVPIENIYNKIQRDKFRWAIKATDPDYVFCEPIQDETLRYFPYFK